VRPRPVIHGRDHSHGGPDPAFHAWEDVGGGADGGGVIALQLKVFSDAQPVTTGDGALVFLVSDDMDGLSLSEANAYVTTNGTTGSTVQLRNVTTAHDMLTTRVTIDAAEPTSYTAAVPPVIDATHALVSTGDLISVDVDAAGTGAKGLGVTVEFS
jgi:hypothetical protein